MPFWLDIADFLIKALIIVTAIAGLAILIVRLARSAEPKDREIKVRSLNERYDDMRDAINAALLDKKQRKALIKARKKAKREGAPRRAARQAHLCAGLQGRHARNRGQATRPADRRGADGRPARGGRGGHPDRKPRRHGDRLRPRRRRNPSPARAENQSDRLRRPGGGERRLHDGRAADRIVAAPFAVVGSIGVVAPVPNLHRLLKKNEIDFEEMTAGEWKRSVSVLGEITPAGREHFRGKLDATHDAFKTHVAECRPSLDIAVANGDHWLAREALALGLVDEILDRRRASLSRPGKRAPLRSDDGGAQESAAAAFERARRRGAIGGRNSDSAHPRWITPAQGRPFPPVNT